MLKWIVWALLALLLLLFFCPVCVAFRSIDGAVTVKVRLLYLFKLNLYPPKERPKKAKKQGKKKEKPSKPPPEKKPKERAPVLLMDIIQTITDLLPILGRSISYWLSHTTINRLWVRTVVHEEDAADTAIRCGQLSAAARILYGWCAPHIRIKDYSFAAVPDFTKDTESLNVCLWVSASPARLAIGMVLFLCRGGVALWRGPLVSQMRKKQPAADKRNRSKAHKKNTDKQMIKDGVA